MIGIKKEHNLIMLQKSYSTLYLNYSVYYTHATTQNYKQNYAHMKHTQSKSHTSQHIDIATYKMWPDLRKPTNYTQEAHKIITHISLRLT